MGYKSEIDRANRVAESSDFPSVVLIDNCNACNLKCSMCDHQNISKYRKIEIMDIALYKKIIDEVAREKPNARTWEIFFGEPFLCLDMAERIGYAKRKGLTDVVLNSNGLLMTEDRASKYITAGLDAIYVGVDAFKEETYRKIRVGGDLKNVVANILGYRDMLKRRGNGRQKIFVQFVVSDINEGEVEAFKKFWTKEEVNVKIRPKVSWAGLVEASNLYDNRKISRRPCYWLMQSINICADGEVALCAVDVHCRVKCGNLKGVSIKEIWAGRLKGYRNMHKEGRFEDLPGMCRDCSDWQGAYADFAYC